MTWKSVPRDASGKDTGSIYALPRTPEGLVKIGYRGIKVFKAYSIFFVLPIDSNRYVFSGPTSSQRRKTPHSPRMANGLSLSR